jgi:hypothetical protein
MVSVWLDQPVSVEIGEDDIVLVKGESGGQPLYWRMPLKPFRKSIERASKAIELREAQRKVVRLRGH